jgi:hypothetical protein
MSFWGNALLVKNTHHPHLLAMFASVWAFEALLNVESMNFYKFDVNG